MSTANEQLDRIDRIHDDDPAQAAQLLRALDVAEVGDDRLRLLAFLVNHVLGEKLGQWDEACERIAALAARPGAPLPVLRQHAVAAHFAGNVAAAAQAIATLAARADSDIATAAVLVRACALEFVAPLRGETWPRWPRAPSACPAAGSIQPSALPSTTPPIACTTTRARRRSGPRCARPCNAAPTPPSPSGRARQAGSSMSARCTCARRWRCGWASRPPRWPPQNVRSPS
ncbi:MAG: hypothetical protein U5L03_11125 [Burkholderiaceae bacterium]|nr:hypothetical protein [Burkholderiaceae bacterium]